MSDLNTILNAVTDLQHRASVQVILPVILGAQDSFYSDPSLAEWKMFKPLADAFASTFAPNTAYSNPLQFINWLFAHPEIHGTNQYIAHLVAQETIRQNLLTNQLNEIPFLLYAEQALNQNGLIVPGHQITSS